MSSYGKKDKGEDDSSSRGFGPFEKTIVLQEARYFHQNDVRPRKCIEILTHMLGLLNQGDNMSATEATEAFFAITKLFQRKEPMIRYLVYLCIKEMSRIADDVIIVTSSLTKDMNGTDNQFRGPAIRALCHITDNAMLQGVERYMKQCIVDKVYSVASATLVSSIHIYRNGGGEIVKRWANEVQEAVLSDHQMVQYHALGLLYQIKKQDRLAVTKLVNKLTRQPPKSPFAQCLLVRMVANLMEEDEAGGDGALRDYLEQMLRHKNEMVIFEAANALVNLRRAGDLTPAISVLQLFCTSPKPVLRFAAVRCLNLVAMRQPTAVAACNLDLENLISDGNRSIATLAITTLLKTGTETSIERLMKQIQTFMSDISDEFKVVVVQAIKSLCAKYPRKHGVLMSFLSSILREDGGLEYKRAIVEAIVHIVEETPESKEVGLTHLCEFIEDCEYAQLAIRILHLLGREGPSTAKPQKYIRYIYNRVILEVPSVRAAAVAALAKFGAQNEDLRPSIMVLLQRCLLDADDEVRDRATLYLRLLRNPPLVSSYAVNQLQHSIVSLERALAAYVAEPTATPFDIKTVPVEAAPMPAERPKGIVMPSAMPAKAEKPTASAQEMYAEKLAAVPDLAGVGHLVKSSALPLELTEQGTEYVVTCVKHIFPRHIVLQFDCVNTLSDQLLENVHVSLESGEFAIVKTVPCPKLACNVPGTTYSVLNIPDEITGSLTASLKFVVKDCDPTSGEPDSDIGYNDEYQLEEIEITVADYVTRVLKPSWAAAWDELAEEYEVDETYALTSIKTLEEAVKNLIQFVGLQPCERSDKVAANKTSHLLIMSGVYRGVSDVLVRAKLALSQQGVALQFTVRSTDETAAAVVASAVG